MSNIDNHILADIEWDNGLAMPIANDENKEIEKWIHRKQSSAVALQNDLEETEDRVNAVMEHLKNMQQELQHTQDLVNAREKELQTEEHILKLRQREKGHLKQQIAFLTKEMDKLNSNKIVCENRILRQNQEIEKLKSQHSWDQKALDCWLEEAAKKDEDAMTIQKYSRQDECIIKELSYKVEKLIAARLHKKHQLSVEVTNTLTCQLELDKTAENFRPAHQQRGDLLREWENTIELMKKRDREMDAMAVQLIVAKHETRRRNNILNDKQQRLEHERDENVRLETAISAAERMSILTRNQLADAEQQKDQFENETEMLRRSLDRMVTDLDVTHACVTLVKTEIQDKNNKLQQTQVLRKTLEEKLKVSVKSALSVGEYATRMDDLLMAEEKKQEKLLENLKMLEGLMCKTSKDLQGAKAEEKVMEVNINCSHNTIKNVASKIKRLDSDILKQQEIIYTQNLRLQQLEKRCFRMQGDQSSEEKAAMEDEIRELQNILDYKNQTHAVLVTQLRTLKDNLRRFQIDVNRCQAEKQELMVKIDNCNLYNASTDIELKSLVKKKQNLMVDESLMKLEGKKLFDLLNSHGDNIMSMEMRKLQLDTALRERQQEIKVHKEMLIEKIKVTKEKRQQVSAELYDKMSRIDKLKMRYKFMIIFMAPPDGDEETSQVYCLIKAAEDKEALQREGDDLDARIRKAEKEIQALENTLHLMNGRNNLYQQSFQKITESRDDMDRKHELDEQMRAVIDKYKYKKRQMQELLDQILLSQDTLKTVAKDVDARTEVINGKQKKISQFEKEIQEQIEKLTRAAQQNARFLREWRMSNELLEEEGNSREHLYEQMDELPEVRDINIREMRDFNMMLISTITDAAHVHPDMFEPICHYFAEANMTPPVARGVMQHAGMISKIQSRAASHVSFTSQTRSSTESRDMTITNVQGRAVSHAGTTDMKRNSVDIKGSIISKESNSAGIRRKQSSAKSQASLPIRKSSVGSHSNAHKKWNNVRYYVNVNKKWRKAESHAGTTISSIGSQADETVLQEHEGSSESVYSTEDPLEDINK